MYPQAPVEAVIALSILYVAAEILNESRGQRGLASRKPWIVAFVFGLLHGLGFAGALREVGLPEHAIPLALAFFNVGVEAGQLLFIAGFFAVAWASTRLIPSLPVMDDGKAAGSTWSRTARLASPSAYVVGTLASFWLIERTLGF
jgi:hypothetical protein